MLLFCYLYWYTPVTETLAKSVSVIQYLALKGYLKDYKNRKLIGKIQNSNFFHEEFGIWYSNNI